MRVDYIIAKTIRHTEVIEECNLHIVPKISGNGPAQIHVSSGTVLRACISLYLRAPSFRKQSDSVLILIGLQEMCMIDRAT